MKRRLSLLALVFGLTTVPFLAQAESSLRVCNSQNDHDLTVAVIYQHDPFYPISQTWHATGWHNLKPHTCQDMASSYGGTIAYIAALSGSKGGKLSINRYPFYEGKPPDDEAVGIETFFCVKDTAYDRVLPRLEHHQSCPSGWYHQLFNLNIYVSDNKNLTLKLGG